MEKNCWPDTDRILLLEITEDNLTYSNLINLGLKYPKIKSEYFIHVAKNWDSSKDWNSGLKRYINNYVHQKYKKIVDKK